MMGVGCLLLLIFSLELGHKVSEFNPADVLEGRGIEESTGISMGEPTGCLWDCSMWSANCLEKVSKDTRQSIQGYFAIYPRINGQVSKDTFSGQSGAVFSRYRPGHFSYS